MASAKVRVLFGLGLIGAIWSFGLFPTTPRPLGGSASAAEIDETLAPEGKALRASAGTASRKGLVLTLHLASGKKLRFKDQACERGNITCETHRLISYSPSAKVFVMMDDWGEAVTYFLIDQRTGKRAETEALPTVSKSGRTVAVGGDPNQDFGRNGGSGITILEKVDGALREVWKGYPRSCAINKDGAAEITKVRDEEIKGYCTDSDYQGNHPPRLGFDLRRSDSGWALAGDAPAKDSDWGPYSKEPLNR